MNASATPPVTHNGVIALAAGGTGGHVFRRARLRKRSPPAAGALR